MACQLVEWEVSGDGLRGSMIEQLQEMKARLEAATPGPWRVSEDERTVRAEDGEIMFDRSGDGWADWNICGRNDAEFIANSPEVQAKLIAALEAVCRIADDAVTNLAHGGGGLLLADDINAAIAEALA